MERGGMRRLVVALAAMQLLGGALSEPGRAARDLETTPLPANRRELVVFETADCDYCMLLRRDVLPEYLRSKRAAEVPVRFINVEVIDLDQLPLSQPLTVVPTVVLMSEGYEVGRITGYIGPELFFHLVSRLLQLTAD
jgi:thioredoxin-related protein